MLSCVEAALGNWSVRHLSIWTEVVEPVPVDSDMAVTLEEAEEVTMDAMFQEVCSKIGFLDSDSFKPSSRTVVGCPSEIKRAKKSPLRPTYSSPVFFQWIMGGLQSSGLGVKKTRSPKDG